MTGPTPHARHRAYEGPTVGSITICPHCASERVLVDEHALRVWECGTCSQVEIEVVYLTLPADQPEIPSTS